MITISRYNNDSFDTLKALHVGQSSEILPFLSPNTIPDMGFIAQNGTTAVAIGFLRLVEGGYAQIDTLVSNAELSSEVRHDGITQVVDSLINAAKELKLKGIMAITDNKSVISRGKSIGFNMIPSYVLVRAL